MKKIFSIAILTLLLTSCKEEAGKEKELTKSNFALATDLLDFKKAITDQDTLRVFVDHSVCTYEGYERIRITKVADSLYIRSEFRELIFDDDQEWKLVYERSLASNDTIWDFEKFLQRNSDRTKPGNGARSILVIENKEDTLKFYTDGLVDLNNFLSDYFLTMREIYPENTNGIYGYGLIEE